jgi:hypothetical protein
MKNRSCEECVSKEICQYFRKMKEEMYRHSIVNIFPEVDKINHFDERNKFEDIAGGLARHCKYYREEE